jgi:tetratricopeptide (TPR) repeat protein
MSGRLCFAAVLLWSASSVTVLPAQTRLPPPDIQRAVAYWDAAIKADPRNAAVSWTAASFFESINPELYLKYLEATVDVDGNHPLAVRPLAHFYGLALFEGSPFAAHAKAALEKSQNVWILGNAAYMLQSKYNESLQAHSPKTHASKLAERYFAKAQSLDPRLDRNAILPKLDLAEVARAHKAGLLARRQWQKQADDALAKVVRLPVEAFPELPPALSAVLRARNCRIPQLPYGSLKHNVIRGQFFAAGENGWAVFCSADNRTALLAFRNDQDRNPDTVTVDEDRTYLQDIGGGKIAFSRQIAPVGKDFITGHQLSGSALRNPLIKHHGIDDAFVEKGSRVWYFHDGKWLQLPGSD